LEGVGHGLFQYTILSLARRGRGKLQKTSVLLVTQQGFEPATFWMHYCFTDDALSNKFDYQQVIAALPSHSE